MMAGRLACLASIVFAHILAGCTMTSVEAVDTVPEKEEAIVAQLVAPAVDPREKECLVRAMYFESNRSSEDGLLGVGTVVMNRLASPDYPDTICEVVGQPRQFAEGVLTKPMTSQALPQIEAVADDILAGKRHEDVGVAMHFHTEGYTFPYKNMHYVAVAGGNAFYEKRRQPPSEENPLLLAGNIPLPQSRPTDDDPSTAKAYKENDEINRSVSDAFSQFSVRGTLESQP